MHRAAKQLQETIESGWAIHIYSSDRHLVCSLYPSHGWTFLFGILLGCVLALLVLDSNLPEPSDPSTLAPMTAPLNLD